MKLDLFNKTVGKSMYSTVVGSGGQMSEPRSRAHLKYLEWWHSAGCVGQSAAGNWIAEIEAERDALEAKLSDFKEANRQWVTQCEGYGAAIRQLSTANARVAALKALIREVLDTDIYIGDWYQKAALAVGSEPETKVKPLEGETKAATSGRAHGIEDAGSPPPPQSETLPRYDTCTDCGGSMGGIHFGICKYSQSGTES